MKQQPNLTTIFFFSINKQTTHGILVGGQEAIRHLWEYYYEGTDGIIFVIDCNDTERITTAREELTKLLSEEVLASSVLLILANKQDLPNALSAEETAHRLGIRDLCRTGRDWFVQPTAAITGKGLAEGFDWLATKIAEKKAAEKGKNKGNKADKD
eukprot:GEZU01039894.1.p1 GENE.GEZU01039894.1~~GEZU01039894.1.p1  ORF type:complete len:156 (-),score=45.79 GEZU01039894.1:40-507(-)